VVFTVFVSADNGHEDDWPKRLEVAISRNCENDSGHEDNTIGGDRWIYDDHRSNKG
jgi:hypothetical protein